MNPSDKYKTVMLFFNVIWQIKVKTTLWNGFFNDTALLPHCQSIQSNRWTSILQTVIHKYWFFTEAIWEALSSIMHKVRLPGEDLEWGAC